MGLIDKLIGRKNEEVKRPKVIYEDAVYNDNEPDYTGFSTYHYVNHVREATGEIVIPEKPSDSVLSFDGEFAVNYNTKSIAPVQETEKYDFIRNGKNHGKFRDGIYFVRFRDMEHDLYCIDIYDTTGVIMNVLMNGASAVRIRFLITETEYYMDSDNMNESGVSPALYSLISALTEMMPADRLYSVVLTGGNGKVLSEMKPEPRCETMDDHIYERAVQNRELSYIYSREELYIMYTQSMGERFPALDRDGCAQIFDEEAAAAAAMKDNVSTGLLYIKYSQDEFREYVRSWFPLGIISFKFNPELNNHSVKIRRDDFLHGEGVKKWGYYGSFLNENIICFKQNRAVSRIPQARACASSYWNIISHIIHKNVFLVPVCFDGTEEETADKLIHYSDQAAVVLGSLYDMGLSEISLSDTVNREYIVRIISRLQPSLFYGANGYTFADKESNRFDDEKMNLRTLIGSGRTYLCGFTEMQSLHAIFGENVNICMLTLKEISEYISRYDENNTDITPISVTDGIVINPGSTNLVLDNAALELLNKPYV